MPTALDGAEPKAIDDEKRLELGLDDEQAGKAVPHEAIDARVAPPADLCGFLLEEHG
jgi:hypothetical protein